MNDVELQDLSQFSSRLFNDIDVRTQEKILNRIIVLHNLAFGDLSHPSILYFELLHQIISYRYPTEHISDWIPEISHLTKQIWIDIMGHSYKNNMIMNGRTFHEIIEGPCALAYWYIATLKQPVERNTSCQYFLRDSSKYNQIVAAAKIFDELSSIIK